MKVRLLRLYALSLAVLMTAALTGCADEVGGVYLVQGESSVVHAVAHQMASVYFQAGGDWTAKADVDWLEVSPASGGGGRNTIVVLTTLPNRTKQDRTGQVTIESGGQRQIVTVTQSSEYALFDPKIYEVVDSGGHVELSFVTNVEKGKLMISYHRLNWINMPEKKSGTRVGAEWGGKVSGITVLPNDAPAERLAPFVLGIYDEEENFLGLDTAWIRQLPVSEKVEATDSVNP